MRDPRTPAPRSTFVRWQEISTGVRAPEARTDLEALQRALDLKIATTFGIPAVMLQEGSRFASSGASQILAFNFMVQDLARTVSHVLTLTYAAIYPNAAPDAVVVRPTPVRHIEELVQSVTSGILSSQSVAPHLMHALGFDRDEVRPPHPPQPPTLTPLPTRIRSTPSSNAPRRHASPSCQVPPKKLPRTNRSRTSDVSLGFARVHVKCAPVESLLS